VWCKSHAFCYEKGRQLWYINDIHEPDPLFRITTPQNKPFHFLFQAVHHVREKKVESASLQIAKEKKQIKSRAVLALIAEH
jgi:hypothetical protein